VEIEKTGKLSALVTQNIDGLHAKAGNSREKILELHGTVHEVVCVDCGMRWPRAEITDFMDREGVDVPYCAQCNGPLKCATVAFGQALPQEILAKSFALAGECDVLITIGSSLVVQPANMLPLEASRNGAKLALINMTPTAYDSIMDVVALGSAGAIMSSVMKEFRQLTQSSSG
jgi:NAD-dependent deacetylase